MSKAAVYILILSLVLLTSVGAVLGIWNYTSGEKFANGKTIVLNEETKTEMEVNLSGICPGDSTSYGIHLEARESDLFDVTMNFKKTGQDSLARFIDVTVKLDGENISTAKLTDYLDGKSIAFPTDFDGRSTVKLEIVYSMDLEVGDEAQNTAADFNVILTATR